MKPTMKELYAKILDSEREIMFYDDEWVYVIFESSNGGWNVDVFTVDEGMYYTSDDYQLKFLDTGLCTGDAYNAIEFMMPELLIDMDITSPQTRKAHT
jgi:hypothetical protein